MTIDFTQVKKLIVDGVETSTIKVDGVEAWQDEPTPVVSGPLCFTAQQDGSSVSIVGWDNTAWEQLDSIFASLQYSTDGNNWQEWDGHVIPLNDGEKVYVKALNPNTNGMAQYDEESPDNLLRFHSFVFEGKVAASGNIQYLLESTGSRTDVPPYAYY